MFKNHENVSAHAAEQVVEVVGEDAKLAWLLARLPAFIDAGDVLVFANQKARVDEIFAALQAAGVRHVLTPFL